MATASPSPAPEPAARPEEVSRRNARDLAMLALGVASLGIIVYDFLERPRLSPEQVLALELLDLAIVLVFALEFAWRWRRHGWEARFVLRNWFDVLGMVPMVLTNFPLFRAFRLLRVGIVASRLLRMWAYLTGHQSAQVVFDRYRAALVEEVADRVMLRGLAVAEDIVARGAYLRTAGDALEARRGELAAMAVKSSKANELGKWFSMVPGFEAALRQAALTAVDTAIASLRSEELQGTFEDLVKNSLGEARAQVARKNWRELPRRS